MPLLTVVFLLSYGLMTVAHRSNKVWPLESQRNLIKILMSDSAELWSMKGKAIADQQMACNGGSAPCASSSSF